MSQTTPIYSLVKIDPTDPVGSFLAWYNSNLDTIDANLGGGGTVVEANPADPATEVLNTIKIGATVYSLPSGGGGGRRFENISTTQANTPKIRETITVTTV